LLRLLIALSLVLGLSVTAGVGKARACSISYKKGYAPEEIKRRFDVRKIEGSFKLTDITGERFTNEDGEERIRNAKLLGEISNGKGRVWRTIQPPPDAILIEICGCDCWYHRPEADATGTFWIARNAKDDRFELLLWEGDYLPKAEPAKMKD
jgi:hypothetical protein